MFGLLHSEVSEESVGVGKELSALLLTMRWLHWPQLCPTVKRGSACLWFL